MYSNDGGISQGRGSNTMDDDFAMDQNPFELPQQKAQAGISFSTDLGSVGHRSASGFSGATPPSNVVDEERRLIDKVFGIIDADRSGQIEVNELKDMFKIFDMSSEFLDGALNRIWQNVEKGRISGELGSEITGTATSISPQEFYKILSQKFNPGDPRREIENVFHKMDKNRDGRLDVDEIHEISQLLGEDCSREEIKEMVKVFSLDYKAKVAANEAKRGGADKKAPVIEPTFLTPNDFYEVMQDRLEPANTNSGTNAPTSGSTN